MGPSQILIKHLQGEHENIIVSSNYGNEIEDIKVMGRDNYIVARTSDTIIIGDLVKNMISEVSIATYNKFGYLYNKLYSSGIME